jgi:hypothetical protein
VQHPPQLISTQHEEVRSATTLQQRGAQQMQPASKEARSSQLVAVPSICTGGGCMASAVHYVMKDHWVT